MLRTFHYFWRRGNVHRTVQVQRWLLPVGRESVLTVRWWSRGAMRFLPGWWGLDAASRVVDGPLRRPLPDAKAVQTIQLVQGGQHQCIEWKIWKMHTRLRKTVVLWLRRRFSSHELPLH